MARPASVSGTGRYSRGGNLLNLSGLQGRTHPAMAVSYTVVVDSSQASNDLARVKEALDNVRGSLRKGFSGSATPRRATRRVVTSGDRMELALARIQGRVEGQAEQALARAVSEGAELQRQALDAAITGWGMYRYNILGQGGSAGRNDTGAMMKAVTWNVEKSVGVSATPLGRSGRGKVSRRATIVGWHGWPDEQEYYFFLQEKGFNHKAADITITGIAGTTGRGVAYTSVKIGGASGAWVEGAGSLATAGLVVQGRLLGYLREIRT